MSRQPADPRSQTARTDQPAGQLAVTLDRGASMSRSQAGRSQPDPSQPIDPTQPIDASEPMTQSETSSDMSTDLIVSDDLIPEARVGADDVVAPTGDPIEATVLEAAAVEEVVVDVAEDRPTSSGVGVDRERTRELFGRLRDLDADDPQRQRVRDSLVEQHLPLVEHLARRFRNRGEPYDDLVQVATIGLIKSVDRFDLERGVEFSTYATPTIVGEIKRHFRDKGWAVRVPRRLQELRLSLTQATSELSQRNGRSPTVAELAGFLKLSEEEILEGLESANAYSTLSLDAGESNDDDSVAVVDTLGVDDEGLEGVEYRESLKPMLEQLPAREKKILLLRFFRGMTQSEIAAEVGISQMHVSRLLARTLAQLREGLLVEE